MLSQPYSEGKQLHFRKIKPETIYREHHQESMPRGCTSKQSGEDLPYKTKDLIYTVTTQKPLLHVYAISGTELAPKP